MTWLYLFGALVGLLVASHLLAGLYGLLRQMSYVAAKALAPNKQLATAVKDQPLPQRFKAVEGLFRPEHDSARRWQDRYHRAIAAAISALFLAFLFFAAEKTFLPKDEWVHMLGIQLDLCAFLISAGHTALAIRFNRIWVRQRTRAELLRQNAYLEEILVLNSGDSVTTRYYRLADELRERLPTKLSELGAFVGEYWAARCALIRQGHPDPQSLSLFLDYYRLRRGSRQEIWFETSRQRLEGLERLRSILLTAIFLMALIVAGWRWLLVVNGSHDIGFHNGLTFTFLSAIAISAGLTGLFFNQNARSLIHRYGTQIARLKQQNRVLATLPLAVPPTVAQTKQALEAVIGFEGLMTEELIDWIEITRRDVAELSA